MFWIKFISLVFLVCCRQAWYVLQLREQLSTSLADVLRHSPSFWGGHSKGQFSFHLSGLRRLCRSWWKNRISPGFIIGVECAIIRPRVVRLLSVNCADVHRGRRYRWRFWRLRWLWAVVLIIAIFYRVYYRHFCQEVEWIGRQVQIVQAWWNIWELPSKSIWHCRIIGIRVGCHSSPISSGPLKSQRRLLNLQWRQAQFIPSSCHLTFARSTQTTAEAHRSHLFCLPLGNRGIDFKDFLSPEAVSQHNCQPSRKTNLGETSFTPMTPKTSETPKYLKLTFETVLSFADRFFNYSNYR